ncbi:MAG: S-layer homology domain-containing protein [Symbiobacterium sp.]|uniref:S-layer homology domain-containing protein n=1 Tax=Symbiobacterium sp. TaxID=1971213 RepID=UPI003463A003
MGLMRKLTSALVASSLVLSLVGTALAAPTPAETNAAYERLEHYGIVQGVLMPDGSVSPALDMTLTRAQIVTIIVRAFGEEMAAQILKGSSPFSDVPGSHWASGYVAIANTIATQKGFPLGYPDGTFQPEKTVTGIEALTFVMKFLGVPVGTGANWVQDTIASAVANGVLTADDVAKYLDNPNAPATRGLAFALADNIFYNYSGVDGTTVYKRYHDNEAPSITLSPLPENTSQSTITVSGKVSGDYYRVYVGPDPVTVAADGTFSKVVSLNPGRNEIEVSVQDLAGNVATATATVTRGSGTASKIEVNLPDRNIKAGSTVDLGVRIVDDAGVDTGISDYEVTIGGDIGTYEDGKFTAGGKLGSGTITVRYGDLPPRTVNVTIVPGDVAKVVPASPSVAPGQTVRLIATDEFGNAISGATFSEDYAEAFIEGDQFIATKPGQYTVTATKDGKTGTGVVAVFGEHAGFAIETEQPLVANDSSEYTIYVYAVDEGGNKVTTFEGDVTLESNVDIVGDSTVEAEDGVAIFKVVVPYGMDGLEAEFRAYHDTGDEVLEGTATFEIASQVAKGLKLEVPKYLAINQPAFEGALRIVDQAGNPVEYGDSYEVTLSISGPAYFSDGTKEMRIDAAGTVYFELEPVDRYTEGTITIRATAPGLQSASAQVEAVYAMAPRSIVLTPVTEKPVEVGSDAPYEFKLGLIDRNGVPVRADDDLEIVLTFDSSKADEDLVVAYVDKNGDDETVTVEDRKATVLFAEGQRDLRVRVWSETTGSIKVTASSTGLVSATGTVEFAAGDPAKIAFTYDRDTLGVLGNSEFTLTVQIKDENDNDVAKSGVKVTFEATPSSYARLNGSYRAYTATTNAQGQASVRVYLLPYEDEFTIRASATLNGSEVYDDVTLEIVPSLARSISVTTYTDEGNRSTVKAGDTLQVRATVTDSNGVKWVGPAFEDRLVLEGFKEDDLLWGPTPFVWNEEGKYYEAEVAFKKAGSYKLAVVDDYSLTKVSGSRTITVTGGPAEKAGYVGSTPITYKRNEPKEFVINLIDEFGNKASAKDENYRFEVEIEWDNGSYGLIRDTATGGGLPSATYEIRKGSTSLRLYFVTDATKGRLIIDDNEYEIRSSD